MPLCHCQDARDTAAFFRREGALIIFIIFLMMMLGGCSLQDFSTRGALDIFAHSSSTQAPARRYATLPPRRVAEDDGSPSGAPAFIAGRRRHGTAVTQCSAARPAPPPVCMPTARFHLYFSPLRRFHTYRSDCPSHRRHGKTSMGDVRLGRMWPAYVRRSGRHKPFAIRRGGRDVASPAIALTRAPSKPPRAAIEES